MMNTIWNGELLPGMEELSLDEECTIVGGESLSFWIGYTLGVLVNSISHISPVQSGGQQLMNAALG